jgi:hypothetical protein
MSDPQRLRSASDNDLERLLLRAGRERAPGRGRQRALLAATAALGTGLAASGSAAAGAIGAKTSSVLSLKWLAVVGLAGVGAMTAAVVIQGRPASPGAGRVEDPPVRLESAATTARSARARPTAPAASGALDPMDPLRAEPTAPVAPAATEAPPAPLPGTPAATGTVAAAPPSSLRSAPSATGTSVHAELATLDQARSALAAGQPAQALAILDTYTATYPRAAMAPEATMLRIEALVRAGDRAAAERLGTAFLESHPQSPYAARIRSLLGRTNP